MRSLMVLLSLVLLAGCISSSSPSPPAELSSSFLFLPLRRRLNNTMKERAGGK